MLGRAQAAGIVANLLAIAHTHLQACEAGLRRQHAHPTREPAGPDRLKMTEACLDTLKTQPGRRSAPPSSQYFAEPEKRGRSAPPLA